MRDILADERVRRACDHFTTRAAEITAEQIALCEIPAPPFGEEERANYFRQKFLEHGLADSYLDKVGNCIGLRKGNSLRPLTVVSAHLDTVFPSGTDCTVRREQGRLYAPGIADDGCGLIALLMLAQALDDGDYELEGSVLFVGTVGEEGEGNLRGVRYLLGEGEWSGRVDAFISLDGPGVERITHAALGSRRYRLKLRGTGGHSWGDFGAANPVHALGRAVARLASYPAPVEPRTTFNVGRIEGGAGVNVIPTEAMMDVDLRSASAAELQRLDAFFRRAAREAAEEENAARRLGDPPLELDLKLIGDRPSGETPTDALIVRLAEEATRAVGYAPRLDRSSTDSNIPISLGIPAVTLGAGGTSGNSHTLEEWYDPRGRDIGLKRALLLTLGLAGIK
ncbi:MAG: M20/M25/M40 family metallo-hydrolase [Acidobacteria bacterium]|nr:M20/M25/M40 family metallo-hydrolase [Acidobacteriota bacterium]